MVVTTMSRQAVSGSMKMPTSTWNSPAGIQVNSGDLVAVDGFLALAADDRRRAGQDLEDAGPWR